MVVIIFGVSGAGKTVIGTALAEELDWRFYDADDFHPSSNIQKMRTGVPLTDEDREPWLQGLRELIERCVKAGEDAVLACSALKKSYRDRLRASGEVHLVYLRGTQEIIAGQLAQRHGHFMNPDLLKSQFVVLEEPEPSEEAIVIELGRSPRELVAEINGKVGGRK